MSSHVKQRVIGAIIFIAILAIFIPLYLSTDISKPTMSDQPPVAPAMPVINLKIPKQMSLQVSEPSVVKAVNKPKLNVITNSWRLKLGSFTYKTHSDRLISDLKKQGFEAYSQHKTNKKGGVTYDVYMGPAVSKVEAVQLQKHLLHALGMPSIIVTYPKEEKKGA